MNKINFVEERNLRIESLANNGKGSKESFYNELMQSKLGEKELILEAFNFAQSIEYDHEGLSKESYLAHPLRVASMSLRYIDDATQNSTILALLHNIFEVGQVSRKIVKEKFGVLINDAISTLTVNRELQWDSSYKEEYYSKIRSFPGPAMEIKVLDKFDNIFLIGQNPEEDIRIKYINEIRKYIIPMAEIVLPELSEAFEYACSMGEKS
tara:strand:- start:813 stop:1442 length:630 start_codon:yes stop_codon:yes gene_type:complete